jgi:hypothetical protein
MKNSEKGKFEDAWQKVFENAEQAPSENVWTSLEQGLNKSETVTMKRRVVFYQRLAAASILFALMLGGLTTYYISNLTNQREKSLVQERSLAIPGSNEVNDSRTVTTSPQGHNDKTINENNPVVDTNHERLKKNTSDNLTGFVATLFNVPDANEFLRKDSIGDQEYKRKGPTHRNYPSLLSMIPEPSIELAGSMRVVIIVRTLPAMPSSFMNSKKDKETSENLWASLGASTGNYSPSSDFSSSSSTSARVLYQSAGGLSNSTQSAYSTTSPQGTVFSVGMNLGKRISNRWLVQGGVSYLNQAIGYTSNFAVVDANNSPMASVADYANLKSFSSVVSVSSPYQINSVNKYISVPVQAGYILIDRKLGLQLNSGVSTDIFMQNTLTDESGQLESYSSGAGDSSPYRTISWAGLMGTELSYKIATHYRISVAPGLRYSLNSVLKSNSSPSNPLMWDVGFRFRYIFK